MNQVRRILVVRTTMRTQSGRRDDRGAKHRQQKEPTYAPPLCGTGRRAALRPAVNPFAGAWVFMIQVS